ncbi:hypothetical protein V6N11_008367 [Hibiscus sabdariffa]
MRLNNAMKTKASSMPACLHFVVAAAAASTKTAVVADRSNYRVIGRAVILSGVDNCDTYLLIMSSRGS